MSETAARLQRLGEDLGPAIRLGDIAGMRNGLAHDYDGTDWNVVEEVVFQDIPELAELLKDELQARGLLP